MANEAKTLLEPRSRPLMPKVLTVFLKDGNADLPGLGQPGSLNVDSPQGRARAMTMEVAPHWAGVLVRYSNERNGKTEPVQAVIPMGHLKLVTMDPEWRP